jgi:tricorn protease-like protein
MICLYRGALGLVVMTSLSPHAASGQIDNNGWRTIEFETSEVTSPDVTLSPDGQRLIFTMLGHLFRMPVGGGTAEQVTFGPSYDDEPVFSPDGRRVAFVSDRDGSEGNVFVLELATGAITQVTHESSAGRPTWAPDGQAIVYLSFLRPARHSPQPHKIGPNPVPTPEALVRRVAVSGGVPETLSPEPRLFRSVFYLPDGRVAWTVIERQTGSTSDRWDFFPDAITRIEVLDPGRTVSTLRMSIRPPYYREDLLFVPLPHGKERRITTLTRHRGWTPRFAVAADNSSMYLVEVGRLWKVAVASGAREPIAFNAHVRLEIYDPGPVEKPTLTPPGSPAPPRSVLYPVLSPDGRMLVFGAAGYLWEQPLDGGSAQRLFQGNGFEEWPAFSPDGRQLAFVHREPGKEPKIRVFDFESRQPRIVGFRGEHWPPSWNRDGKRLVFGDYEDDTDRVVALNLSDGTKERLLAFDSFRSPRPQFSADGQAPYHSDTRDVSSRSTGWSHLTGSGSPSGATWRSGWRPWTRSR